MNVLVVFQLMPEETKQYLLSRVDDATADSLKEIHGKLMNCHDFTEEQGITWRILNEGFDRIDVQPDVKDVTDTPVEKPDLVVITGIVI